MTSTNVHIRAQLRKAKVLWGTIPPAVLMRLTDTIRTHGFSVTSGDLLLIDRSWYVSHHGLLALARRNRCLGIHVRPAS
jgi:hypothetical protein